MIPILKRLQHALVLPGLLMWAAAAPAAEPAAEAARSPIGAGSVLQMVAGLALVVILIFALAWAVRRFGNVNVNARGALRVVGALSMGARERVVLIEAGDKQILLGVAPGRVQTLHVLDEPIRQPAGAPAAGNFADRLRSAMGGKQQ